MALLTPGRRGDSRGNTLGRLVLALAAGLLVAGALVLGAGRWLADQRERDAAEAALAARSQAGAVAEEVVRRLGPERQRLLALEQDAALAAAFAAGDGETLRAREQALAAELPGVLKVRLLAPGAAQLDTASRPPLGFASVELLRQAETGEEPVPVEALFMGSPDAHLVMVGRVRAADGSLAGLAHLSLDPARLEKLDSVAGIDGRFELQQPVQGEAPLRLASGGAGDAAGAGGDSPVEPVRVAVPGTRWEVVLWPAPTGLAALAAPLPPWLWLAGAGVLLLVVAGVMLGRRAPAVTPKPRPAVDTTVYGGAIKAIMQGAHPGMERFVPGLPGAPPVAPRALLPVPAAQQPTVRLTPGAGGAEAAAVPGSPQSFEDIIDFGTLEQQATGGVPAGIFRHYDVRGVVEDSLTDDVVYALGRAVGSELAERGQSAVVVARDGRLSSPALAEALMKGLEDTGREVIDIGLAPAPVLYFATHCLDARSGVMVTGSHNGSAYNGFKIIVDGEDLCGEALQGLRRRMEQKAFVDGTGSIQQAEMVTEYIRRLGEDIPVALGNPLKIVVDCGNAVSGAVAPSVLRALGHDVIELFCELDGHFPNHDPDPGQPENMVQLVYRVLEEEADLGLAFDGDGDRLGVVDGNGNIIWPDRQLMLLARDVLSRNPGAEVVYDVKCSRQLGRVIEAAGGRPVMCKTGRSFVKARMREGGAPLAGEFSGHLFFGERWYGFDDAFYAAARLVEILMADGRRPAAVFEDLPEAVATPEVHVPLDTAKCRALVDALIAQGGFGDATVNTVDGLRVDFADGFGLVRPSNTSAALVMRFEGDDEAALQRIQADFAARLKRVAPDLVLPL